MDELIRDTMHDALDAEPPPAGLRARVIASVPMRDRTEQRPLRPRLQRTGQFAAGFVAGLLMIAVIAGLLYSRQALSSPNPGGGSHPASAPRLISPEGIAVAPDGTVYVSDYYGNRVFRLLPGGDLVSIAGGGIGGDGGPATKANLAHPSGLAVDRQGNLYVADNLGGTIRRIDRRGVITSVSTVNYGAGGLAVDGAGVLYVGTFYGALRSIDAGGKSTELDLSSLPPPVGQLGNMAFDSAGNLDVSDRAPYNGGAGLSPGGGCRIIRLNVAQKQAPIEVKVIAGTGTCGFSGDGGPATSAELNDPDGVVVDADGNLYIADAGNSRLRRVDKNGIITTVAGTGVSGYAGDGGPATQAQLSYPLGLGITPDGVIYIADPNADPANNPPRVRAFRISDGTITTVATG